MFLALEMMVYGLRKKQVNLKSQQQIKNLCKNHNETYLQAKSLVVIKVQVQGVNPENPVCLRMTTSDRTFCIMIS